MKRLLLLFLCACGPNASDAKNVRDDHCPVGGCVDAGVRETGPITIPNEPLENWDTTNAGPLTGIFAVEAIVKARAGVEVEIRQLLRLRIVQRGDQIQQKTTVCKMKLPDVPDTATLTIPPSLESVIQSKGTETTGPYLNGSKYVPPPFLVVVGAKLANEATDPLPTQMDLANALDEDNDMHPGVTLGAKVATCSKSELLYVALRTSGQLTGSLSSTDLITGKVDVKLQENVLGYSDDCLALAAMLKIEVHPGSPFTGKRTTADDDIDRNGNVSCPEIILRAPATFGDYWSQP